MDIKSVLSGNDRRRRSRGADPRADAARACPVEQGDRVHAGRATRELGLLACCRRMKRRWTSRSARAYEAYQREADRPRTAHLPASAPGHERDLVLPAAARPPGRDDADRLHADGRPGVRAVQPHLSPPARAVHLVSGARRHRRDPGQRRVAAGRGDRRHRRRAHPRPGRPGRRRHGHPDRQALALHGLRRHPPGHDAADPARRRHQQPRSGSTIRSTSAGGTSGSLAPSTTPSSTRSSQAVKRKFPGVLLQWEDFAQPHAGRLLERYRDQLCTFNDDIQGTAAVTTGTLLAAVAVAGGRLRDQRVAILGAGSAGCGIAEQLVAAMVEEGLHRGRGPRLLLPDRPSGTAARRADRPAAVPAAVRPAEGACRRLATRHGAPIGLLDVVQQRPARRS